MNQGQAFGNFTYQLGPAGRLSLMGAFIINDAQFPNRPDLPPLYQTRQPQPTSYPSVAINSSLESSG
jgi:hypothetical protein